MTCCICHHDVGHGARQSSISLSKLTCGIYCVSASGAQWVDML